MIKSIRNVDIKKQMPHFFVVALIIQRCGDCGVSYFNVTVYARGICAFVTRNYELFFYPEIKMLRRYLINQRLIFSNVTPSTR